MIGLIVGFFLGALLLILIDWDNDMPSHHDRLWRKVLDKIKRRL